jgi:hypothetical protein
MTFAPVVLFVYNRIWHIHQTVNALKKNRQSQESDLFIFSDGFRNKYDRTKVQKVRQYIKTISGFRKVTVIERDKNLGLSRNIISGVTEIISRYGELIVLEDDMVTSPYFLTYMNDALEKYRNEDGVISIHGYIYPIQAQLPATFFLRGADCWGWGTWKRGWNLFEADGQKLLSELKQRRLTREFDFDGVFPYTNMLADQIRGRNNSWAIRWYASAFLRNKFTLYPGISLINNIGNDSSGTHCGDTIKFNCQVAQQPIHCKRIVVEEDRQARIIVGKYLKSIRPSLRVRIHSCTRKITGRCLSFFSSHQEQKLS